MNEALQEKMAADPVECDEFGCRERGIVVIAAISDGVICDTIAHMCPNCATKEASRYKLYRESTSFIAKHGMPPAAEPKVEAVKADPNRCKWCGHSAESHYFETYQKRAGCSQCDSSSTPCRGFEKALDV